MFWKNTWKTIWLTAIFNLSNCQSDILSFSYLKKTLSFKKSKKKDIDRIWIFDLQTNLLSKIDIRYLLSLKWKIDCIEFSDLLNWIWKEFTIWFVSKKKKNGKQLFAQNTDITNIELYLSIWSTFPPSFKKRSIRFCKSLLISVWSSIWTIFSSIFPILIRTNNTSIRFSKPYKKPKC